MPNDTRDRMIDAAKASFRARGVTATGFTQVLQESGAARGAIYHHFPGGKGELTRSVMSSTGSDVALLIGEILARAPSPSDAVLTMFDLCIAESDRRSGDFGCPVTPAVLEADGDQDTLAVGDQVFEQWQAEIAAGFAAAGEEAEVAASLAALTIASLEGALVLSRAARSAEPLRRARGALARMIQAGSGRSTD